jgi:hypothetical protein
MVSFCLYRCIYKMLFKDFEYRRDKVGNWWFGIGNSFKRLNIYGGEFGGVTAIAGQDILFVNEVEEYLEGCFEVHGYSVSKRWQPIWVKDLASISAPLLYKGLKCGVELPDNKSVYLESKHGVWYVVERASSNRDGYILRETNCKNPRGWYYEKYALLGTMLPKEILIKDKVDWFLRSRGLFVNERAEVGYDFTDYSAPALYKKFVTKNKSNFWVDLLKACEV